MKATKRNIFLLVLAIIGVLTMLVSITAYAWLFLKVNNTLEQISIASGEVQLLSVKNEQIQTVRREVRDTQEQRAELNSYFITEEGIVDFIEDIEKLGEHAGASVSVQAVSVGDPLDKDGLLVPLSISLKSEGTLREVFYTLALLEAFPKALNVKNVRFAQHPTDLTWQGVFDIVAVEITSEDNN